MASQFTEQIETRWGRETAPSLRAWWTRRGSALLRAGTVLMIVAALGRMLDGLYKLIWATQNPAAVDLKLRYLEVHTWFAGQPVYGAIESADYAPASYAMFWPLLGWLALGPARLLWATATLAALCWLAYLAAKESWAKSSPQWPFIVSLIFSTYPVSSGLLVGQPIILFLPLLAAGLLLLHRGQGRLWEDMLAAVLLTPPLVKPTISAPFYWLVLFIPGRLRPMVLIALAYIALTLLAAAFQEAGIMSLMQAWLRQRSQIDVQAGHSNLSAWFGAVGLGAWALPLALVTLSGLGAWTWRRRRVDVWILIGVTALIARLWIHHRVYDDLLIVLPMITLLRIVWRGPAPDGSDITAGLLFALAWAMMLAPVGAVLRFALGPFMASLATLVKLALGGLWLAMLGFLLRQARQEMGLEVSKSILLQKA